jgi:hypothetical protein
MGRIKLDETAKVVSMVSVAVGMMIAVAGYFTNQKLRSLDEGVRELEETAKQMEVSKATYDLSARLTTEFSLPLARSFAEQYIDTTGVEHRNPSVLIPTSDLMREFELTIPDWKGRRGLMVGNACDQEGLKARQIVTLLIKNIGHADAVEVRIAAKQKASPYNRDPRRGWQEVSDNRKVLGYHDLLSASSGWTTVNLDIEELRGQSAPPEDRNQIQVVLASVSGTTMLFGTVLVPITISWTDRITKERQTQQVHRSHTSALRHSLLGAEIGSLSSSCRQLVN